MRRARVVGKALWCYLILRPWHVNVSHTLGDRAIVTGDEVTMQVWLAMVGWRDDESVIHRVVGGTGVMRAQLERLLGAGDQGKTTIQVVPYGAGPHPGLAGPFIVLGFTEQTEPDVVYLETVGGNLYVDKPEEVQIFETAFDHLRAAALSPTDTRAMLHAAARDLR